MLVGKDFGNYLTDKSRPTIIVQLGKPESRKGDRSGVRGGHSPRGKRRKKDRAGGRGNGALLLSPGLQPLLLSVRWGSIRISASRSIQPGPGLSEGPIKGRWRSHSWNIWNSRSPVTSRWKGPSESFRGMWHFCLHLAFWVVTGAGATAGTPGKDRTEHRTLASR